MTQWIQNNKSNQVTDQQENSKSTCEKSSEQKVRIISTSSEFTELDTTTDQLDDTIVQVKDKAKDSPKSPTDELQKTKSPDKAPPEKKKYNTTNQTTIMEAAKITASIQPRSQKSKKGGDDNTTYQTNE